VPVVAEQRNCETNSANSCKVKTDVWLFWDLQNTQFLGDRRTEIESLDDTQDEAVTAAWDEEIARRMADIDSGAVKPVSLEEARRRLLSAH